MHSLPGTYVPGYELALLRSSKSKPAELKKQTPKLKEQTAD